MSQTDLTELWTVTMPLSTIAFLVLSLTWASFTLTPAKRRHPIFAKALLDEDVLQELLSAASLCFAPGLLQVLQSATPPTVDYFKSLPTE
jgi:hypothetical protein